MEFYNFRMDIQMAMAKCTKTMEHFSLAISIMEKQMVQGDIFSKTDHIMMEKWEITLLKPAKGTIILISLSLQEDLRIIPSMDME